ncbi:hypothetical protein [Micromonospora sp. NPDC007220]|uniref:hypothetical protein n=1 Tax=Micromonospora sp. NPDC007220 TaxID=3154318 RepID=UPI0033F2BCDC
MDDALRVLRREFESVEGSFLLRLRCELVWDRAAFSRLEQAMRVGCEQYESHDDLPRWVAEGFYEVSHFVAEWTAHPNFPRPQPAQYYQDCLERLRDLTDWFFRGWHAYQEPHVWRDL